VLRLFPQITDWDSTKLFISFVVNYTLLPLVTVLLAKKLGFIDSVFLTSQKDRIIPYIATGVFYFWIWHVFRKQGYPYEVLVFSLAVFLSTSLGLLINIFLKVSMHTLGAGVVLGLFLLLSFRYGQNFGLYTSIVVFICGLICTSRLINNDHSEKEVYTGLAGGLSALGIAALVS
jgi:hypothetical protein